MQNRLTPITLRMAISFRNLIYTNFINALNFMRVQANV